MSSQLYWLGLRNAWKQFKLRRLCLYSQTCLNPDKTEHLPKPNDFFGPEFFPYFSLLKNTE